MLKPKKILIIEDEAEIQRVLTDRLVQEGFVVVNATNGRAGVEAACKHRPDLILLDIIMPVMDGIEALKKIRAESWGKQVKFMILTNLSPGSKSFPLPAGLESDYLVKSEWKLEDIVKKIKEKLGDI
jgi:CheY-like chemotaxis protein